MCARMHQQKDLDKGKLREESVLAPLWASVFQT